MQIKKMTQKDSQGNTISFEFNVPPMQEVPKYDHPGVPKGTDTVPAWLTPGEFVMNAEATRMFKPQIEAMNNAGQSVQKAQGGTIPQYKAEGGKIRNDYKGALYQGAPDKGLGNLDSTIVDFIPGVGDAKAFAESQTPFDYSMAILGLIPGLGDLAAKAGKTVKHYGKNHPANAKYDYENDWNPTREPEDLWDISPEVYRKSQIRSSHGYSWDDMMEAQSNGELLDSPEVLMKAIDELAAKGDPDAIRNVRARTRPEIIYDDGSIPFSTGGQVPQYKAEGGGIMDWLSSMFGGSVPEVQWPENEQGIDPNIMVDRAPASPPPQRTPAQPKVSPREWIIGNTLGHEGGKADDPVDKGGKTNFGITQKTYDAYGFKGDVNDLTPEKAKEFYNTYYDSFKVDSYPAEIRDHVFDMFTNHSPKGVAKILQKAAGVKQDGKIGPKTMAALKKVSRQDLVDARKDYYEEIMANDPSQEKFRNGWIARAESFGGKPVYLNQGGDPLMRYITDGKENPWYKPEDYLQAIQAAATDEEKQAIAQQMTEHSRRTVSPEIEATQYGYNVPMQRDDSGLWAEPVPSTPVEKVTMDEVPMPSMLSPEEKLMEQQVVKPPRPSWDDANIYDTPDSFAESFGEAIGGKRITNYPEEVPTIDEPTLTLGDYKDILNDPNRSVEEQRKAAAIIKDKWGGSDVITNRKIETLLGSTTTNSPVGANLPGMTGKELTQQEWDEQSKLVADVEERLKRGEIPKPEEIAAANKAKSNISGANVIEGTAEDIAKAQKEASQVTDASRAEAQQIAKDDEEYRQYVEAAKKAGLPDDQILSREERDAKKAADVERAGWEAADAIVNATKPDAGMEKDPKLVEVIDKSTKASPEDIARYKKENNITPDKENAVMSFFEEYGITDLFDKKEIGKMVVMYLGSRALGYSHGGSLNFAMKSYAKNIDTKITNFNKHVNDLIEKGEYRPDSIALYKKTKNPRDLVKKGGQYVPTGETKFVVFRNPETKKAQRIKVREVTDSNTKGKFYQTADGTIINQLSEYLEEYRPEMWEEDATAYNNYSMEARDDAEKTFNSVIQTLKDKEGVDDLEFYISSNQAAREFVDWARELKLDPKNSAVQAMIGDAYRAAYNENKGKKLKPEDLKPYLTRMSIIKDEGHPELYQKVDKDGKLINEYMSPVELAELRAMVKRETFEIKDRKGNPVTTKQITDYAATVWGGMGEKEKAKYYSAAKGGDSTAFGKFLMEQLNQNAYDSMKK